MQHLDPTTFSYWVLKNECIEGRKGGRKQGKAGRKGGKKKNEGKRDGLVYDFKFRQTLKKHLPFL